MELREDILNEINQISPLVANIGNKNPYYLPVNYFDNLSEEILQIIKATDSFQSINMPYQIPAGYFDGLANNILSKIKLTNNTISTNEIADELATVAPFLNTINKTNIYHVPENYFETFTVNAAFKKPAKIINFTNRNRKWFAYAAAAVVTGIIAISILFFNRNNETNPYAQINKINISADISKLTDDEINNYLSASTSGGDFINDHDSDDNQDVQDYLNNASDEEIQQYLNETKNPGEKIPKKI